MKLIKSLILLLTLTLATLTSYCQSVNYPITKRVGKDSVVVITVGQADEVNSKYVLQLDSIKSFKTKLDSTSKQLSVLEQKTRDYDEVKREIKIVVAKNKRLTFFNTTEFWGLIIYGVIMTFVSHR